MQIVKPDEAGLAIAVDALRAGEVVAYPTETVYGLAVDPCLELAIQRLFAAKGRPDDKPILLVVADEAQLTPLVREIPSRAQACISAFWPGPLSLIFPKHSNVSDALTAGGDTVCIRCPACVHARNLCRAFGGALTSSSANRSGEPPACSIDTLSLPGVSVAIDGGVLGAALPSTVYNPSTDTILRQGPITAAQLADVAKV